MTQSDNILEGAERPGGVEPEGRADPLVGVVVDGRYTIEQPLASGGMGSVYLASQRTLGRQVAIKVVQRADAELLERFRREAESLAEISHPAVVEVHDFIVDDPEAGRCFLVMSYVEGEDLEDYLQRRPGQRLSPGEAVDLITPVVSALVQLHAAGIVHRDIKPANIIRYQGADGRAAVKLVDFGIARLSVDSGLTGTGLIIGTPPYMSPETLMGKRHTPLADVYAVGATLWELIAGDPPFGKGVLHQVIRRALQEPAELPAELVGSPVGDLLLALVDKEEERRPDAFQTLERLESIRDLHAAARVASGTHRLPEPGLTGPVAPATAPTVMAHVSASPAAAGTVPASASGIAAGPGPAPGSVPTVAAPVVSGPSGAGLARDAVPTAVVPGGQGAPATGAVRSMTGAAGPAGTVSGASPVAGGRGGSRGAWRWIVPLVTVPLVGIGVVLGLALGGGGADGGEGVSGSLGSSDRGGMRGEVMARGAVPRDREPGDRPGRRTGLEKMVERAGEGDTDADGLARSCKTAEDAKRLFTEAKGAVREKTRAGEERAILRYKALLRSGCASASQRRWSARLLANIYLRRGACGPARRLWRTYQGLARRAGKQPKPFGRCR